ncbi:MAG: ECF transporter S component, partial [Clostridia bacterium]|nr:ECF transporter S component [Clostridia bacterium]
MNTVNKTRKLVGTAMLAAVSVVLMFLSFPVPLMPSFIKLDLAEIPALIGAFAYGPLAGAAVCLVKNLISLMKSSSGGVGTLCNFLLGLCFVVPAGVVYMKKRTRGGALIGALIGAAVMAIVSVPINYYVVYPIYTAFMPMEAIIGMYQAINPKVQNLWQALIWFNCPFTFVKGLISVVITFIIYKPLSPILKGAGAKART